MSTFIRPQNEEDNRQPTYGTLSIEEKQRGIKAIENSIKYTRILAERQRLSNSNNQNLRDYENKK